MFFLILIMNPKMQNLAVKNDLIGMFLIRQELFFCHYLKIEKLVKIHDVSYKATSSGERSYRVLSL